jgi:hypothetical protein
MQTTLITPCAVDRLLTPCADVIGIRDAGEVLLLRCCCCCCAVGCTVGYEERRSAPACVPCCSAECTCCCRCCRRCCCWGSAHVLALALVACFHNASGRARRLELPELLSLLQRFPANRGLSQCVGQHVSQRVSQRSQGVISVQQAG